MPRCEEEDRSGRSNEASLINKDDSPPRIAVATEKSPRGVNEATTQAPERTHVDAIKGTVVAASKKRRQLPIDSVVVSQMMHK